MSLRLNLSQPLMQTALRDDGLWRGSCIARTRRCRSRSILRKSPGAMTRRGVTRRNQRKRSGGRNPDGWIGANPDFPIIDHIFYIRKDLRETRMEIPRSSVRWWILSGECQVALPSVRAEPGPRRSDPADNFLRFLAEPVLHRNAYYRTDGSHRVFIPQTKL